MTTSALERRLAAASTSLTTSKPLLLPGCSGDSAEAQDCYVAGNPQAYAFTFSSESLEKTQAISMIASYLMYVLLGLRLFSLRGHQLLRSHAYVTLMLNVLSIVHAIQQSSV